MAQIARNTADKATAAARNATDNVAEAGKRTFDQTADNTVRDGLRVVRQAADAAAEVEQKTARRAGEGMAEINQSLVDLFTEQAKHNVQLFQALAQPANWRKGPQLQSEFLRASFQRTARFTQRYVEVGQAVLTSALSTAQSEAGKSA